LKLVVRGDLYNVGSVVFFLLLITEKVAFEKVIVYTFGSSVCSDIDSVRALKSRGNLSYSQFIFFHLQSFWLLPTFPQKVFILMLVVFYYSKAHTAISQSKWNKWDLPFTCIWCHRTDCPSLQNLYFVILAVNSFKLIFLYYSHVKVKIIAVSRRIYDKLIVAQVIKFPNI
jgi:hypothetical protein